MQTNNTELDRLKELFRIATNASSKSRKARNIHEEFYYNDVDNTKTQLDRTQLDTVKRTYNIPVSTKIIFAIIEHLLSFYTATKPFPKYVAAEQSSEEFPLLFHKLFMATWYESQGYSQLEKWIRDSLVTGDGCLLVRRADFFNESTTNVVIEHKSWKHIVVDPECRKPQNYKDADYVIVVDFMRKRKAEKIYDIKIKQGESFTNTAYSSFYIPTNIIGDLTFPDIDYSSKDFYVAVLEFYEKEETNAYICSNPSQELYGLITNKRPKSIEIPNPEKEVLRGQIDELQKEIATTANQSADAIQTGNDAQQSIPNTLDMETFESVSQEYQAAKNQEEINSVDLEQKAQQLQLLQKQYYSLSDTIPAFEIEVENKAVSYNERRNKISPTNTYIVTEVVRQRIKQIKKTLIVGEQILDREYLPTDEYPIINLPFSCKGNPNDVYGVTHFTNDIAKAMNKYLAQLQLDMSINAHRKFFVWENTIVEPAQMEENYANPGSAIKLKPDPMLPDGGKPIIIDHAPLNQSFQFMLDYFKQLIEYITGVHGVIQGDSSSAPSTYGATQSLQAFGTNRIKLFSRAIEISLENLAYVVAKYLQAYCPRDKVIAYFDDNNDKQEVSMLENTEDFKFKVRVDIGSSLPTTRQMTGQQLAFLAQTFSDDTMKAMAMEYMLKIQDVPEAREIAEKMNIVKQQQEQIAQLEEQLKQSENAQKSMQNQFTQKEAAHKVKEAELNTQGNLKEIEAQAKANAETAVSTPENDSLLNDYEF